MEKPDPHRLRLAVVKHLPQDYAPWGDVGRWKDPALAYPDCSMGCRHAHWLHDPKHGKDLDWCVCVNPESHRAGLLTFEHQGCQWFEAEPET